MKVKVRFIGLVGNNEIGLKDGKIEDINIKEKCVLSIDGSTNVTGMGILRESDGALICSMAFEHEKDKESAVQYKVRLKREMYKILSSNPNIKEIFYEEPFIGYAVATKNLFMLRTFVEELKFEYEPELDYVGYTEINNLKWKKAFLDPIKCPSGTDAQKRAIREKLVSGLPFLSGVTQDEIDAIAMGFVAVAKLRLGDKDELKSKKKAKPFKYNIRFIGADTDDGMLSELWDIVEAPQVVLENGILLTEIKGRGSFDNIVYEKMGLDDKLLILKFKNNRFGNIILKYRIGHLAESFEYIYAVIWRKARKK